MKIIQNSLIENFLVFLMIIFIYVFNNQTVGIGNSVTNILILLFIFWELISTLYKRKIIKNAEQNSLIVFVIICAVSLMYSYNFTDSMIKVKTITVLILLLYSLIEYLNKDDKNITFLLKTLAMSGIIASLYIMVKSNWKSGIRVDNIIGDSNQVAAYISYAFTSLLYLIKTKNVKKPIGIVGLLIMFIANVLSGSRSGLIVTLLAFIAFLFLTIKPDKKAIIKIIFFTLICFVLLYLIYYIIINNEVLYKIIGRRYVSFFEIMSGHKSSINEKSTLERSLLLKLAWEKFTFSPFTIFLGNGIGYFASYWNSIGGRYAFCHNNYLELLSGVGIIGTIPYYYTYMKTYAINRKRILKKKNLYSILCFTILMQMLLMHWFIVFYYQKCEILYIAVFIYINALVKSENKKNQRIYVKE